MAVGDIIWKPWHSGVEEWWTESFSSHTECAGNYGEDPKCSDSVGVMSLSINDHLHYYNVDVGGLCDTDMGVSAKNSEEESN